MGQTAYLKSTKPESDGDFGKVTRYNEIADDYDLALGGRLPLNVAGSANVTLTRLQALNKLLKFTGTLTGSITVYIPTIANVALSPPTTTVGALGDYIVWNATSGAFTLTIKTSASGSVGVVVSQGTKARIAHDGTDVFTV